MGIGAERVRQIEFLCKHRRGRRTKHDDALMQHLRQMVDMRASMQMPADYYYNSNEHLLLDAGVSFQSRELTAEDREIVRRACRIWHKAEYGNCYMNAQRIVHIFAQDDVRYAEGFATGKVGFFFPMLHGWIVLPSGAIYDPTWKPDDPSLDAVDAACGLAGAIPETWAYRGLIFEHEVVSEFIHDQECWTSMLDNWMGGSPLLKRRRARPRWP
jgi:hypothetical protein